MKLQKYLQSWTGDVRFWAGPDGIQVDRAYPHVMDAFQPGHWPQPDPECPWLAIPTAESQGVPVYSAGLHYGEEVELPLPVGALFFRGCRVNCAFCSDAKDVFSSGPCYSPESVGELINALQLAGARAIDLVNPDSCAKWVGQALSKAKIPIPVIWNTHGYRINKSVAGLWTDIYLIDIKFSDQLGSVLSHVNDYLTQCLHTIEWALERVGEPNEPPWHAGVMLRYLVMPGVVDDAATVFKAVAAISPTIPVHIMDQYIVPDRPVYLPERQILREEYDAVWRIAQDAGLTRLFGDGHHLIA